MIRATVLGVIALLCPVPSACLAQYQGGVANEAPTRSAARGQGPAAGARAVTGEGVVDLADFVAEYLAQTGTVPDYAQVSLSSGQLATLSAAEVFALLARTAYLWRFTGALPETVPITPDELSPPVLDPEDFVVPPTDEEAARDVPTEQFLAVCSAVVRWVDRLQILPTSVYVEGQRLSAAEYLAGLAICVSYAYWEGQLHDSLTLPAYAPPYSWLAETDTTGFAEMEGEEATRGQSSSRDTEGADWGREEQAPPATPPRRASLPFSGTPEVASPQGAPRLTVYPEPGSTVSGIVDVVAAYAGPPARFVILTIDSHSEIIMNSPPYGYRWDTRDLEAGVHSIRVQVLGDGDALLADQTTAFIVVPSQPEAPELEVRDDL